MNANEAYTFYLHNKELVEQNPEDYEEIFRESVTTEAGCTWLLCGAIRSIVKQHFPEIRERAIRFAVNHWNILLVYNLIRCKYITPEDGDAFDKCIEAIKHTQFSPFLIEFFPRNSKYFLGMLEHWNIYDIPKNYLFDLMFYHESAPMHQYDSKNIYKNTLKRMFSRKY